MSNPDLTDKQVIEQIIKTEKSLGFRLADPEFQNELYLRVMSFHNPKFRELVYDGKLLSALLDCHPIEGIVRTANNLKSARAAQLLNVDTLTPYQKTVLTALEATERQWPGATEYTESSWLCFTVWMAENATIRAFMEKEPSLIYQVRPHPAISTSRLRRFLVEEGYGSKSVPVLS